MPIYEYECESCGKVLEYMQKFSDPSPDKCECGGRLHKLISNSSFHLKGTGWYVTDYKNKDSETPKKTASKSSAIESSTTASASTSTSSTATPPSSNSCSSCSCHA